jgi:hypothetical protein
MKLTLYIFLTFFSIQLSYSQSFNKDSVSIIAYWEKGEKVLYELEKVRKETRNGQVTKDIKTNFFISFEVIEQTEEGYVLKYKYEKLKDKDETQLEMLENLVGKFEYEIETSNTGVYLGLRNWEAIKANTEKMIDLAFSQSEMKDEEKKQARAMIQGMFSSKAQIEAMANKDIAFLFQLYGYSFVTNQTIEYEESLPNVFGGQPFTGNSKITFKWLDETYAKMESSLTLDPIKTKQAVKEMIMKMVEKAGNTNTEVAKEMEKLTYDIKDEKYQIIDTTTGWLKESKFHRKTIVKQGDTEGTREDITFFRRKDN